MRLRYCLLISMFAILGCSMKQTSVEGEERKAQWHETKLPPARGVALLLAGLNNRSELLGDLQEEFLARGFHTQIVELRGHSPERAWREQNYAEVWLADFSAALNEARARFPDTPLLAVGYSLGATVALASLSETQDEPFHLGIFFAPALEIKLHAKLIRILSCMASDGLLIPSVSPSEWRAHDGTSLGAYRGLFQLIDRVNPPRLKQTPMAFVLDPKDEMVSALNTQRWKAKNELTNIDLIESNAAKERPHHMLISRKYRTEAGWSEMMAELDGFLKRRLPEAR